MSIHFFGRSEKYRSYSPANRSLSPRSSTGKLSDQLLSHIPPAAKGKPFDEAVGMIHRGQLRRDIKAIFAGKTSHDIAFTLNRLLDKSGSKNRSELHMLLEAAVSDPVVTDHSDLVGTFHSERLPDTMMLAIQFVLLRHGCSADLMHTIHADLHDRNNVTRFKTLASQSISTKHSTLSSQDLLTTFLASIDDRWAYEEADWELDTPLVSDDDKDEILMAPISDTVSISSIDSIPSELTNIKDNSDAEIYGFPEDQLLEFSLANGGFPLDDLTFDLPRNVDYLRDMAQAFRSASSDKEECELLFNDYHRAIGDVDAPKYFKALSEFLSNTDDTLLAGEVSQLNQLLKERLAVQRYSKQMAARKMVDALTSGPIGHISDTPGFTPDRPMHDRLGQLIASRLRSSGSLKSATLWKKMSISEKNAMQTLLEMVVTTDVSHMSDDERIAYICDQLIDKGLQPKHLHMFSEVLVLGSNPKELTAFSSGEQKQMIASFSQLRAIWVSMDVGSLIDRWERRNTPSFLRKHANDSQKIGVRSLLKEHQRIGMMVRGVRTQNPDYHTFVKELMTPGSHLPHHYRRLAAKGISGLTKKIFHRFMAQVARDMASYRNNPSAWNAQSSESAVAMDVRISQSSVARQMKKSAIQSNLLNAFRTMRYDQSIPTDEVLKNDGIHMHPDFRLITEQLFETEMITVHDKESQHMTKRRTEQLIDMADFINQLRENHPIFSLRRYVEADDKYAIRSVCQRLMMDFLRHQSDA